MQNSLRFPQLPNRSVFKYKTSGAVKWRLHFTIPSLPNVSIFTCKTRGRVKWALVSLNKTILLNLFN